MALRLQKLLKKLPQIYFKIKKMNTKDRLIKLRDKLKKYNREYYNSNPSINDSQYDDLKREYDSLLSKYPEFKKFDDLGIGTTPSSKFKKFKHYEPMLSLSNSFNLSDSKDFFDKASNFLKKQNSNYVYNVDCKIDGVSLSLIYKDNKLFKAITRGDGIIGEDITQNVLGIKGIPHVLKKCKSKLIEIRGEVFFIRKDFEKLNKQFKKKNQFSNPRNAASGSLRQINSKITHNRPLRFIPHGYGKFSYKEEFLNFEDFLSFCKNNNFDETGYARKYSSLKIIYDYISNVEKKRSLIDFDVDGMVIKISDLKLQRMLGSTNKFPRWSIAAKFSSEEALTQIEKIELQIGRTGAITPVARLKPINIGGVIVSNATLHNFDEVIRKDIRVDDFVWVKRAGDVIPYISKVDLDKRKKNNKKFNLPKKCLCGSKIIKIEGEAVQRCSAGKNECKYQKLENFKHFVSKKAMNIDGLGEKLIEKFITLKLISNKIDIYRLEKHKNKITSLEGFGEKSFMNLIDSINKSKITSLSRYLYSLGLRYLGENNSELISLYFKNKTRFKNFIQSKKLREQLENIDGLGKKAIDSFINYFSDKSNLEESFAILDIIEIEKVDDSKINLNKSILFTGTLQEMSRDRAKELAKKKGYKIASNVSKNLDILVYGEKSGSKLKKAEELKINILNEKDFLNLIN